MGDAVETSLRASKIDKDPIDPACQRGGPINDARRVLDEASARCKIVESLPEWARAAIKKTS